MNNCIHFSYMCNFGIFFDTFYVGYNLRRIFFNCKSLRTTATTDVRWWQYLTRTFGSGGLKSYRRQTFTSCPLNVFDSSRSNIAHNFSEELHPLAQKHGLKSIYMTSSIYKKVANEMISVILNYLCLITLV